MQDTWREVLQSLHSREFNCCWVTIAACNAGAPMQRKRWICYATKGELPMPGALPDRVPDESAWNPFSTMPQPCDWLTQRDYRWGV